MSEEGFLATNGAVPDALSGTTVRMVPEQGTDDVISDVRENSRDTSDRNEIHSSLLMNCWVVSAGALRLTPCNPYAPV